MRSLLGFLGLGSDDSAPEGAGDSASVRAITAQLESLPPERARFLASFAFLLGRIAHADFDISPAEVDAMRRIVREKGELDQEAAELVVSIATDRTTRHGHTENFRVAREFKKLSTRDQRRNLVGCLFAVGAADESISSVEEHEIRRVADELGLSPRELANERSAWRDARSVMQTPSHDD